MSRSQRAKGNRGESEARDVLLERGYSIIETSRGRSCEDIIATAGTRTYSVEVKWHELWNLKAWRRQAKANAAKRKAHWMLMVRITGAPHTFYVEDGDGRPRIWTGNGAAE